MRQKEKEKVAKEGKCWAEATETEIAMVSQGCHVHKERE